MQRLLNAFRNSQRAFGRLMRDEAAFRQEVVMLLVAIPAAWFVATSLPLYALLVGSVLFVILVEVLNTAIEATCDAFATGLDENVGFAKDCGSLAVLIAIVLASTVWLVALWLKFHASV